MSFGITQASLNFELKQEIGQEGRNSQVFIAHDKQLDADLVIKKIEKSSFSKAEEYYSEAKRLYDSEHNHVVQVKYACSDNDYIYVAMPYYSRGSLKKLIDTRFLTVREIIRYATQFLSGLHNIHVKKLIHFDVKPDNILISDANEALISDFGLAKNMNHVGLSPVNAIYNPHMPPEAFMQSDHSMLFDIYNSGSTLYRMCNGNSYFESQLQSFTSDTDFYNAIRRGEFPDRTGYFPHIPKDLVKVVNKALHKEQTKRYQTVLQLINDLAAVQTLLDWQFMIEPDKHLWLLDSDDKIYKVILNENNGNFATEVFRTIKSSQNTTKIHKYTKNGISSDDVISEVQSILLSLE